VVTKVVKKAKAGDMAAARLVLERVAAGARGPRRAVFCCRRSKTTGDVVSALAAVTAAVSDGQLSPDEACEVAAVVELQRRAISQAHVKPAP
jgi:hypothetical protein